MIHPGNSHDNQNHSAIGFVVVTVHVVDAVVVVVMFMLLWWSWECMVVVLRGSSVSRAFLTRDPKE